MEDQEKFEKSQYEPKNLKLLIDFEEIDLEYQEKQMEIEYIKYKTRKANRKLKKKEEVNLKRKSKGDKFLF